MNELAATAAPVPELVDESRLRELRAALAKKLLLMQRDCGYVQKDKKNENRSYGYASAEAILKKVSGGMIEHGLASYPVYNIEATEERTTQNGRAMQRITMVCNLHVIDTETGFEIVASGYGCGEDDQDKAPMKAQTSSLKCTWTSLLNISTGADPEKGHPTDPAKKGEREDPAKPRPAAPPGPRPASAAPGDGPRDFSGADAAKGAKPAPAAEVVRRCWCKDVGGQHLVATRGSSVIVRDGKQVEQIYFNCGKPAGDPTRCKSVFYVPIV